MAKAPAVQEEVLAEVEVKSSTDALVEANAQAQANTKEEPTDTKGAKKVEDIGGTVRVSW